MRRISSTSNSSGFTLLEILVAGSLAVLGFFFLLNLLSRTAGVMNRVLVVSQLQQNCEMTVNRLTTQVARCDVGGVSFVQDPALSGLALHPIDDVEGDGHKHYASTLTLVRWTPATQALVEIPSLPLVPADQWQPTRLDADAIGQLSLRPVSRELSRSVSRMELYSPDQNCPIRLRLDFQSAAPGYGTQLVHVERFLNVRNVL